MCVCVCVCVCACVCVCVCVCVCACVRVLCGREWTSVRARARALAGASCMHPFACVRVHLRLSFIANYRDFLFKSPRCHLTK